MVFFRMVTEFAEIGKLLISWTDTRTRLQTFGKTSPFWYILVSFSVHPLLLVSLCISAFAGSLVLDQGKDMSVEIPKTGVASQMFYPNSKKMLRRLPQLSPVSASINVTLKPPQLLLFSPTFKSLSLTAAAAI